MDTGFPLVMLIGPVMAAAAALILRGYRRVATAVGLVALALLALLLMLAAPGTGLFADNTVGILGRELVLTPFIRSLFLFLYLAMAALFVSTLIRPAGRALVPVGLAVLSPLAAALMISPAGLGAVLIVVTTAIAIPVLHGGRFDSAAAAWRYFLLAAVGLVPILLAISGPVSGSLSPAWLWPLLATLLWLGAFPFHIGVTGLGRRAALPALSLVLGLVQCVVVVYLLQVLDGQPAVRSANEFQAALRWSAALSALVAAFLMARAAGWRELLTGLLVLDMGLLPLAALSPGPDGLMSALPALISRFLSLLLLSVAVVLPSWADEPARLARLGRQLRPALWLYGGLSLIGLPLTPGFPGRWAQLAAAGQGSNPMPVVMIALALGVGSYCVLRAAALQFMGEDNQRHFGAGTRFEIIWMISLLAIAGLLGLFPGLVTGLTARIIGLG